MFSIFKPVPVYIKLFTDKIEITNLKSGQTISRNAKEKFSTSRIVLADFFNAETLLKSILDELIISKSFLKPQMKVVIQQMEKMEGGLSKIEMRAMRDLAERCGGNYVIIIEHTNTLTNQQALMELSGNQN